MLGIALAAAPLFGYGWRAVAQAHSADEKVGAVVPWALACLLMSIDILLGIGWAIWAIART